MRALVTSRAIGDLERARLVEGAPWVEFDFVYSAGSEALARLIADGGGYEVVLAEDLPASLPIGGRLQWIQLTSAGVEHLRKSPVWREPRIRLATSSGVAAPAMAQYAIGYVLRFAHNLIDYERVGATAGWEGRADLRRPWVLSSRTLGVLGYGAVGQRVAALGHALGMRVIVVRRSAVSEPTVLRFRTPAQPDPSVAEIWPFARLPEMLAAVDFLVVAAPLTDQTRGLIDGPALALMKSGSYVINVSRGPVIDEAALAKALTSGHLAAAAVDVYSAEPISADNPLLPVPNAIKTPHVSGTFDRTGEFITDLFLENLGRARTGAPLVNEVDRERGY